MHLYQPVHMCLIAYLHISNNSSDHHVAFYITPDPTRLCMQAAVDMAKVEVMYGSNAQLIALAKMIITEQDAEIMQFDEILADMSATSQ